MQADRQRLHPLGDERRVDQGRGFWAGLVEGISYAATQRGLAAMLILLFAISIGGRAV